MAITKKKQVAADKITVTDSNIAVKKMGELNVSYIKSKPYDRPESKILDNTSYSTAKKEYGLGLMGTGGKIMFRLFPDKNDGRTRALANCQASDGETFAVGCSTNLAEQLNKLETFRQSERSRTVLLEPEAFTVYIMEGEEVNGEETQYFKLGTQQQAIAVV